MATFTGLAGTNNTFTGTAAADTFLWAAVDLNNLDTATGGGGADVLRFTTAGTLADNALAGISGIPTIQLAAGTNSIKLLNGNLTGVPGARISVLGSTGNDTIDASGLTGANAVSTVSGSGLDVLRGGAGNDVFRFAAIDLSGDTVSGGLGSDRLEFSTAGAFNLAALAGLSGVEAIALAAGTNTITLANANLSGVAGGRINVLGGTGNDTINAAGLTGTNAVLTISGAGLDVLTGGAGGDIFRFAVTDLNGDTVSGGLGSDRLELTTAGVLNQAMLAGLSGVETIALAAGTNTLTLANGNLSGVASGRIDVFGGTGNDTVNAGAAWHELRAGLGGCGAECADGRRRE